MNKRGWAVALLAGGLAALCLACPPGSGAPLSAVEAAYEEARSLRDRIDVTRARGAQSTRRGTSLADLVARYRAAREKLQSALQDGPPAGLGADDRRALDVIKRTFGKDLADEKDPAAAGAAPASADEPGGADCAYDPVVLSQGPDGMKTLSERMRSEEHTSELQSQSNLVCRLLLEKKNNKTTNITSKEDKMVLV